MQDYRYVGLDVLTQAASTRRNSFQFLSQLAYNSEILSKFVLKNAKQFEFTLNNRNTTFHITLNI